MIDAHCHVDLYKNPLSVANDIEGKGVPTIAVTNLPSHYEIGYSRLKNFKYIRLALGLHPLHVIEHTAIELQKFTRLARMTSYIGEIGLDFSREGTATKEKQVETFRFVLTQICDRPRFITLHSRKAEYTVLRMLDEFSIKGAIFHWYSGSLSTLKQIITAGHYFSVNPAMINSANGRKIIENIPPDRILTETDGPFIKLDGKVITFQDISRVLKHLCSLWDGTYDDIEAQVRDNFRRVLLPIKKHQTGTCL